MDSRPSNQGVEASSPDQAKSPTAKGKQSGKGKASAASTRSPAIKVIKKNRSESLSPEVLEREIAVTEKRLTEISEEMSQPDVARDATKLVKLDGEYKETEARLAVLYDQWEQTATQGQQR